MTVERWASGRIAYVGVPDLPIQVERRRQPELRERPLIVLERRGAATDSQAGRQVVLAASSEAVALGVGPGQTARQAEHRCPEAATRPADPLAYAAAFDGLLAALGRCSPLLQPDPDDWGGEVDAGGLELLIGPDRAVAAELLRCAARAGLRARVGLGVNRLVARLAAGQVDPGGYLVVPPAETGPFLAPLPLSALPLSEESRERLELLGVRSLYQLLRLPRARLGQLIGPDALALVRSVEQEGALLATHRPAEWLEAEADLDRLPETLEQLAHTLRPLIERLAGQLRERGLGAGLIQLRLTDPPRPPRQRSARLVGRGAEAARLLAAILQNSGETEGRLELLADQPDRWQRDLPSACCPTLQVALGDLGPLAARQAGLFEGQRARREQAQRAVAGLAARFQGRLVAPTLGRP